MGDISDTIKLLPGTRFHLDFGFIRASSLAFGITAGHSIVTYYDRNTTFLLIVCAKTQHTWVFCQPSKAPPIHILERFLEVNGLNDIPRFLRMDQGGKLWRSKLLRDVAAKAGYAIEPTVSDTVNENDKRTNGTFNTMVHFLLYSAGLSAKFWFVVLVHAVYLKIRLFHKALHKTQYEECTGVKPPLGHLYICGSLVKAQKPGKRPTKADRHTEHGVLLGFSSTSNHVRYFDTAINQEKLSSHHVIDGAYYGKY
jgi:hypothetical protein